MRHIIKRQIINAEVPKRLHVFEVQQRISKFYHESILKVLEKLFDELSDENYIIEFDHMEIDVGQIQVKELQRGQLDKSAENMIRAQLRKIMAEATEKRAIQRISPMLSTAKQWMFYMENGFLPWNTSTIDALWYEKVLEAFAVDHPSVTDLRKLIVDNTFATERIFSQHSASFLVSLAEILTAQKKNLLHDHLVELSKALSFGERKNENTNDVLKDLWLSTLKMVAKRSAVSTESIIKDLIWANVSQQQLAAIQGSEQIKKQLPQIMVFFNEVHREHAGEFLTNKNDLAMETFQRQVRGEQREGIEDDQLPTSDKQEDKASGQKDTINIIEDGIFISNAGLVLLHPFLNSFFEKIGTVNDGHFINSYSHQKSLYALHYLATEKAEASEHQLVLAKILCAFPLDHPVQKEIELVTTDLEECDQLLKAVIEQWSILKNTSPAGLREGFLQRDGKLFSKNKNMHLMIESGAIDILLDHLPWNLSIIKLPWMNQLLRVEWR